MSEEKNIEQRQEDRKSESLPTGQAGPEEIHDSKTVNIELQTSNEELQAINNKPQTEEMEVHHHPEVEKKGFKEYLLEGLMIFVAVTMGFFAENIREYFADKEHAQQLSGQLLQDLKKDTANLNINISREIFLKQKGDTLFDLLQQPLAKTDLKKAQELISDCYHTTIFRASSGAITAIKNELHLKQFSGSKIASYITDYEAELAVLKYIEDYQGRNEKQYIEAFMTTHFTPVNMRAGSLDKAIVNGEMRNLTQNDMTQLSVDLQVTGSYDALFITHYTRTKDKAEKLMEYITREYNLENE